MARKSYYLICPRGFANEYTVGIATTAEGRQHYESFGFERISRAQALRELTNPGDNATKIYATVTVDGRQISAGRLEVARELRMGGDLPVRAWGSY